jgi:hypothetical protein
MRPLFNFILSLFRFLKFFVLLLFFIILIPSETTCTDGGTNTIAQFHDIIDELLDEEADEEQIQRMQEFMRNLQTQSTWGNFELIVKRILLALALTALIFLILKYGPDLLTIIRDMITGIPGHTITMSRQLLREAFRQAIEHPNPEIAQLTRNFLLETARQNPQA